MSIIGWQIEPKIGELEPKKLDFSTNLPDMKAIIRFSVARMSYFACQNVLHDVLWCYPKVAIL